MAMANFFYVTLGRDNWRKNSLCLQNCMKFQTLRSQDVSKGILTDLLRKDFAKFSEVFPFPVCNSANV